MRVAAVLLVLLFVPVPASGQGDPAAPVQTVIDAVPVVVRQSIEEASFDLSPHDAEATLALMETFVQDFLALPDAPPDSDLARIDAQEAYAFGTRIHALAARVPGAVAEVERTRAACASWSGNATVGDAVAWGRALRSNLFVTVATAEALVAEAQATELPVDPAPIQRAADRLRAWEAANGVQALDCMHDLEITLGITPPATFILFAVPQRSWPAGDVVLLGATSRSGATIQLTNGPLGLDEAIALDGQTFRHPFQVPADAPLGAYDVTATDGERTATERLMVEPAPAQILLELPARVVAGEPLTGTVRVASPLPQSIGAGPVVFSGGLDAEVHLADAQGTLDITAPEAGAYTGTATYPGSDRVRPASTPFRIDVVTSQAALGNHPSGQDPVARDGGSGGLDVPWTLLAFLTAALAAALLVARFLPRAVHRLGTHRPARPSDPSWPRRGLVAAFTAVVAWLIARGFVQPSHTPREIAAWLSARHVPAGPLVADFERVRYGGRPEPGNKARIAPAWLRRAVRQVEEETE